MANNRKMSDHYLKTRLSEKLTICLDALQLIGSGTEDELPPYTAMPRQQMVFIAHEALKRIREMGE